MGKTVSKLCLVERDEAPELAELWEEFSLKLAEVAGAGPSGARPRGELIVRRVKPTPGSQVSLLADHAYQAPRPIGMGKLQAVVVLV